MECVAYLRVSTEKQAEEGNGLDSQKRDIMVYASKNEMVIKEWYIDDGYTGSNMNRLRSSIHSFLRNIRQKGICRMVRPRQEFRRKDF